MDSCYHCLVLTIFCMLTFRCHPWEWPSETKRNREETRYVIRQHSADKDILNAPPFPLLSLCNTLKKSNVITSKLHFP